MKKVAFIPLEIVDPNGTNPAYEKIKKIKNIPK